NSSAGRQVTGDAVEDGALVGHASRQAVQQVEQRHRLELGITEIQVKRISEECGRVIPGDPASDPVKHGSAVVDKDYGWLGAGEIAFIEKVSGARADVEMAHARVMAIEIDQCLPWTMPYQRAGDTQQEIVNAQKSPRVNR